MTATDERRDGPRPLLLRLALALVLFLGVQWIYAATAEHDFVNYDDDRYVTANEEVQAGLTRTSARWALTATTASNWHPVTWLSHQLDVERHGLDAGAHHRTSVLLHGLAAVLCFFAFTRLTGRLWPSFLVAALFAWHPLRVESVAWIAERKDVLAGLFAFATLYAYAGWARRRSVLAYASVVLFLALGLASKPMLVTLPCVLILLDRWPLGRTESLARLVYEKLPLFLVAGLSSWMTLRAQAASGATELLGDLPVGLRLANALAAFGTYLFQSLWPEDLAVLVPHAALTSEDPGAALRVPALVGGLLLAGGLALGTALRRRAGYVLVGWLWLVGTLVPVSGLVQVGYQAHADRYTYLPLVGAAVALAFALADLGARHRAARVALTLGASLALVALAARAREQVDVWRDSRTLWAHCLDVDPNNFVAHNNLGNLALGEADNAAALRHFEESRRLYPGTRPDPVAAVRDRNLAGAYVLAGRLEDAVAPLESSIALLGSDPETRLRLAQVLVALGRDKPAVKQLRRVLELEPGELEATSLLAEVLATSRNESLRDGPEAVRLAKAACQATGYEDVTRIAILAAAQAEAGRWDRAVKWQEQVVEASAPELRAEMESRLSKYRRERPWQRSP